MFSNNKLLLLNLSHRITIVSYEHVMNIIIASYHLPAQFWVLFRHLVLCRSDLDETHNIEQNANRVGLCIELHPKRKFIGEGHWLA